MFDFNSTIDDIHSNLNDIAEDITLSNLDIRVIFYNKYKLLIELVSVKNTKFYKITNISETACYSSNRYIIPLEHFESILDYKMKRITLLGILNKSYKKVAEKYAKLINTTAHPFSVGNSISIYQDDIFEVVYLYGYDREKTNGNVTTFIRIKEDIILDDINNLVSSDEFYDIFNIIKNNNVFDFNYYYTNIINKIVNRDFSSLFSRLLNNGYIKLYKDISNRNKFYILFNYKELYMYMKNKDDDLDAVIKHMLGFNKDVTEITEFPYYPENKSGKNVVFKNSTHTLEVVLTNKIENMPEYVLNAVKFNDDNTRNIGMYEVTVIE
nr:MAG TPA: hypothetical protein [Caudoviricetes sp.]